MESIHNARITATELRIIMLYRQELADEPTVPTQWRLIVSAGQDGMSSQFERIDRINFHSENGEPPCDVDATVATLVRRVMPNSDTLKDYTVTVEVNRERARAFRSRKGAKTLPKTVTA